MALLGNLAVAAHVLLAAVVIASGALQLLHLLRRNPSKPRNGVPAYDSIQPQRVPPGRQR